MRHLEAIGAARTQDSISALKKDHAVLIQATEQAAREREMAMRAEADKGEPARIAVEAALGEAQRRYEALRSIWDAEQAPAHGPIRIRTRLVVQCAGHSLCPIGLARPSS